LDFGQKFPQRESWGYFHILWSRNGSYFREGYPFQKGDKFWGKFFGVFPLFKNPFFSLKRGVKRGTRGKRFLPLVGKECFGNVAHTLQVDFGSLFDGRFHLGPL